MPIKVQDEQLLRIALAWKTAEDQAESRRKAAAEYKKRFWELAAAKYVLPEYVVFDFKTNTIRPLTEKEVTK